MTTADAAIPSTTFKTLGKQDVRVLGLAALGGALEFYDFIVFVYLSSIVEQLFFPEDMPVWLRTLQTFGIFAIGYLIRPLGGGIMAHFGDLIGRKALFMVSILLMAVPTLLIGMLPTYASWGIAAPLLLLLLRVCQGVAFAGEGPGATTFVAEHVPRQHIGLAGGALACGFMVGLLLGVSVSYACRHFFSEASQLSFAWRLPFLLGGVLGFVALWVRRQLHETPVFEQMRARRAQSSALPIGIVLKDHRRTALTLMLAAFVQSCLFISVVLLTPVLLPRIAGVSEIGMLKVSIMVVVMTALGCLIGGCLSDRFTEPKTWVAFCALGGGCFALLQVLTIKGVLLETQWLFWVLYGASGFLLALTGIVSAMAAKMFPAEVRFSGVSFSTNSAYALSGGITPLLLTTGIHYSPWAIMVYVLLLAAVGSVLGITLMGGRMPRYL
ncbi:MFS transporter [Zymobacter sp. IVIA_5232.4 C2]|uniref:MFS transporter n=1 Tax=Zymobacter sp. IVIA_5232.4 C2 TaxID=3394855 RepID=UPI0039C1E07B